MSKGDQDGMYKKGSSSSSFTTLVSSPPPGSRTTDGSNSFIIPLISAASSSSSSSSSSSHQIPPHQSFYPSSSTNNTYNSSSFSTSGNIISPAPRARSRENHGDRQQPNQSLSSSSSTAALHPLGGLNTPPPSFPPSSGSTSTSIGKEGGGLRLGLGQAIGQGDDSSLKPVVLTEAGSSNIIGGGNHKGNAGFRVIARPVYSPPGSATGSGASSSASSPRPTNMLVLEGTHPFPFTSSSSSSSSSSTNKLNSVNNGSNQPPPNTRRPSLLTQQLQASTSSSIPLSTNKEESISLNDSPNESGPSSGEEKLLPSPTMRGSTVGMMAPPPTIPNSTGGGGAGTGTGLASGSASVGRKSSLKDRLFNLHGKEKEREKVKGLEGIEGGLRLDTSVGGVNHSVATPAAAASGVATGGGAAGGTLSKQGSLRRGRSYGTGGEGSRTPISAGSSSVGGRGMMGGSASSVSGVATENAQQIAGWKTPSSSEHNHPDEVPEEVIETADLMFGKDERSGRKMINQYLILQEIGRGQHGQVRLGQDMSSPESSRSGSSAGIHTILDNAAIATNTSGVTGNVHSTSPPSLDRGLISPLGSGGDGQQGQGPSNLWAIKIVDRQPRKKLPGMRRIGAGVPEASVANEKLKREIAILKKCRHPNVVRLREVIDAPISKKIYLILEYCEGGEVKWKSDEGLPLLTVAEARRVFRDVVCGLEYLHRQGIIHRDIKPANLLYTSDGVVKISDFGVSHYSHVLRANREDGSTESPEEDEPAFMDEHDLAKTAGSPAFFAPELCYNGDGTPSGSNTPVTQKGDFNFGSSSSASGSNMDSLTNRLSVLSAGSGSTVRQSTSSIGQIKKKRPPITQAIDIWALGVTLYCFLFGRVPFDSTSEYALFSIIPTQDFAISDTMGADKMWTGGRTAFRQGAKNGLVEEACEVLDLLEKLLEKDPTKRITLEAVKRHPFTLRDISDHGAWLASTDPNEDAFVTVSNEDVAAAITTPSSFLSTVKRGVKHLSSKLNIFSGGSIKSRSRSHSNVGGTVPQVNEFGQMPFPSETASAAPTPTGTVSQMSSPNVRGARRLPSTSSNKGVGRQTSNASDNSSGLEAPSPRAPGAPLVARRMSWLQSNSSRPSIERARSPVSGPQGINIQSPSQVFLGGGSSDGHEGLGRSFSDRSTTSSSGQPAPRMPPSRRQSTHLVPPTRGSPQISSRALASSPSADALDQIILNAIMQDPGTPLSARAISLRNKQSAELAAAAARQQGASGGGRPRAESNASSGGGLGRIARLFSRNQSQRSVGSTGGGSSYLSGSHKSEELLSQHGGGAVTGGGSRGIHGASLSDPSTPIYLEHQIPIDPRPAGASLSVTSLTSPDRLHRKSAETVNSSVFDSSSRGAGGGATADDFLLSSPDGGSANGSGRGRGIATLPPLGITDWDGREAFGMSPERRPDFARNSTERLASPAYLKPATTMSNQGHSSGNEDHPDWDGTISDDDDSDGEDFVNGLQGGISSLHLLPAATLSVGEGFRAHRPIDGSGLLGLNTNSMMGGGRLPMGGTTIDHDGGDYVDSPATIVGPGPTRSLHVADSPTSSPRSASFDSTIFTTSNSSNSNSNTSIKPAHQQQHQLSPPPSPHHPDFNRNRSISRTSMRGSPLRLPDHHHPVQHRSSPILNPGTAAVGIKRNTSNVSRAKSPLGRTSFDLSSSPRFQDAFEDADGEGEGVDGTMHEEEEDDEEEDGLEMDFGRGRRQSNKLAAMMMSGK